MEGLNFDEATEKLQKIVGDLQRGNIPVGSLQTKVDEALACVKVCRQELDSVKKKVESAGNNEF